MSHHDFVAVVYQVVEEILNFSETRRDDCLRIRRLCPTDYVLEVTLFNRVCADFNISSMIHSRWQPDYSSLGFKEVVSILSQEILESMLDKLFDYTREYLLEVPC